MQVVKIKCTKGLKVIPYSPAVIYLTGDRNREAIYNYMMLRHHIDVDDMDYPEGFVSSFLRNYNFKPVIAELRGVKFLYPDFNV